MGATARTVLAIFLFCSILSPLASADWYWDGMDEGSVPEAEKGDPDIKHGRPKPKKEDNKGGVKTKTNFLKFNANGAAAYGGGVEGGAVEVAEHQGGLRVGFYQKCCPRAEQIVYDVVSKANDNARDVTAAIVRLQFHDCFVNGCDASILLEKTPSGERVEKQSPANNIKGFNVMDDVKSELEKECPGTVSCADIIAFAARDALNISGLPHFEIPSGRRDGLTSREADVTPQNIPGLTDSVDNLIAMFERKGMTVEDMVVLIGAHSIGVSSCLSFAYRVEKGGVDHLMAKHPKTASFMRQLGGGGDKEGWFDKYAKSTVRMGNIGVLTGTQGEIRKQCRFVN